MNQIIAVPTTNGMLDAHFGHCKSFALFEICNKEIVSSKNVDAPPHVPGKLPLWLAEQGVTDVIAGGMGQGAISIFNKQKINVFVGAPASGSETIVKQFLNNTLAYKSNYCNH